MNGCFASEETKNQNRKSEKAKVLKSYIFSKLSFVIWPGRNELFFKLLRSFKKRSIYAKNSHSFEVAEPFRSDDISEKCEYPTFIRPILSGKKFRSLDDLEKLVFVCHFAGNALYLLY